MELIKLEIPSEEEIEFQIALVDEPAIESDYMVFKQEVETRYKFQELDKSKKLLMGYFMIADLEIPRFDKNRGAYNVVFPKESIDKIVRNFSKNGLNQNMNEMHQTGKLVDGVYVLHHWQLDSEMEIKAPKGFKQEADGSWFGVVRCENEEIYQKALNGDLKGFSIEGRFIEEELFNKALEELFNDLKNITESH
jgi:hypothetical protein